MKENRQELLFLRNADRNDMDMLLQWANDEEVRRNAFHSDKISPAEHREWFLKLLQDKSQRQYIMMHGQEAIGQVRLSILGDKAEIGYSIVSKWRGKGYGRKMIGLVLKEVRENISSVNTLIAKVKILFPAVFMEEAYSV